MLSLQEAISNLRRVPDFGKYLARGFQSVEDAVNQMGTQLAVDATGTLPPPPPIQAVNVSHDGSNLVHVTLSHFSETQKNLKYFVEWGTDAGFSQPHVEDLGVSRGRVLNLPQGTYFVRGYHQPPGGKPSKPVNFGGTTPTPIVVSSGSTVPLLPSAGSGTASPFGTQGGYGIGKFLNRPAIGPKRQTQA